MKEYRNYIYHESTISLCSICGKRVTAKIILQNNQMYIQKNCSAHGIHSEIFEEDAEYHLLKRKYDKPGTQTPCQTVTEKGCPFDCGLCPEHDQHTCVGLIEITDSCNLNCPVCFANSGKNDFLSIETIDRILTNYVELEGGEAEILQISGGEPTIHPDIIEIIKLALSKNIRFVMLNTNGLRIASDPDFVRQLSQFKERFEIYLQFDGFRENTHLHFRGKNLADIKTKAIKNLLGENIPVTLVSTVEKGINDDEIGDIISYGMNKNGIRGVSFQPVSYVGRINSEPADNRVTLSGLIRQIEKQLHTIFQKGDIFPLPCNVERVAISYLVKNKKGKFWPLSREIKVNSYLPVIENTFAFDADRLLDKNLISFNNNLKLCECFSLINELYKFIPKNFKIRSAAEKKSFIDENTFRISITSFIDPYNFDLKSAQKECVHILTPDLKRIPFSVYNMLYRK